MRNINIEFQEQYKRLDRLCKDIFGGAEGVSAYIKTMEIASSNQKLYFPNWDSVYKQLKHLRWKRNQLAHEISIDDDFCSQDDVEWIERFYQSIISRQDILTQLRIIEKKQKSESSMHNRKQSKSKPSLWNKIVSKIKSWFEC